MMNIKNRRFGILLVLALIVFLSASINVVNAEEISDPSFKVLGKEISVTDTENPENYVTSIQIMILMTVLTLAPAILIMMTSFTRIIIVLHFIRTALATQQTPPNQVLIGLTLFLTLFIMTPVIADVNDNAIQPYLDGEITQQIAQENALKPIREFMYRQTSDKDLALFVNIAKIDNVSDLKDIPTSVLIPAFIISEMKTAFIIGFVIYIPFLVIDMVVASTLMAMGMMMLPPVMISVPFKLLLFIMVDGWNILMKALVTSFR